MKTFLAVLTFSYLVTPALAVRVFPFQHYARVGTSSLILENVGNELQTICLDGADSGLVNLRRIKLGETVSASLSPWSLNSIQEGITPKSISGHGICVEMLPATAAIFQAYSSEGSTVATQFWIQEEFGAVEATLSVANISTPINNGKPF